MLDPHAPELRIAARSQHIRRRGNWKAARMVAYYYAGAATELGAVKKYI